MTRVKWLLMEIFIRDRVNLLLCCRNQVQIQWEDGRDAPRRDSDIVRILIAMCNCSDISQEYAEDTGDKNSSEKSPSCFSVPALSTQRECTSERVSTTLDEFY